MKNNYVHIFLFIIFLISGLSHVDAQIYYGSTEPTKSKWQQITTENFKIVFEDSIYYQANYVANLYRELDKIHPIPHLENKKPFPVLLHSQSTLSNGFVTWAPRRMEMVTVTPQDVLSQPWLEQISIHEYEHVYQLTQISNGFSRFLKIPFGQASIATSVGQLPLWSYEGNAVILETELSQAGRGRDPLFLMDIKANVLNGIQYSYEKYYYGSFKNHVPDYYPLGYIMTSYGREKFGPDFHKINVDFVSRKPYLIYPFYFSLKKNFNTSKKELFRQSFTFYDSLWQKEQLELQTKNYTPWNKPNHKNYTSYRFPFYINDSTLLCIKSGIDQRKKFILLSINGDEHILHEPGIYESNSLSYANKKLVWSEIEPDIRWGNVNYSVIKLLDIDTKKISDITKKSKLFAPSLNKTATKIVAVEINRKGENFLAVIDAISGKTVTRMKCDLSESIQMPVWKNENEIVYTKIDPKGKYIASYHLLTDQESIIYGPVHYTISNLSIADNTLFYSSSQSGINNVFAYHFPTGNIHQITNSNLGTFYPQLDTNNNILYFNEYSSQGYNIGFTYFNTKSTTNENTKQVNPSLHEKSENSTPISIPNFITLPSKKYCKPKHLFNPHSWAPFYTEIEDYNVEDLPIYPGFMLLTQNLLGSLIGWGGYSYRNQEHHFSAKLIYQGLYPVIETGIEYGGFPDTTFIIDNTDFSEVTAKNQDIYARLYIPLNFSKGKFIRGIRPSLKISYKNAYIYYDQEKEYRPGITQTELALTYSYYLRPSYRDILPRLGIHGNMEYLSTPFEHENLGTVFSTSTILYLPGLFTHHAFRFNLGYTNQMYKNYFYPQNISFPRGYPIYLSKENTVLRSNYALPLFYPDWNIGTLLYIKRFRTNLFFDYGLANQVFIPTENRAGLFNKSFTSFGFDLISEFHTLHFFFPLNLGIRYTYAMDAPATPSSVHILFNLDIPDF